MRTLEIKPQNITLCWKGTLYATVLHVLYSLYETLSYINPLYWELRGEQKMCCVVKNGRACENGKKQNKDSMWHVLYGEYVFSWDIWLHQLEFLYCCCDKWLYSQLTSFCFSVLLDCSLASSSPHVYFCHFSLLLPRNFPCLISCSCSRQHTQAWSLAKFETGGIHSSFKSNSYPKTSVWVIKALTVSKMHF